MGTIEVICGPMFSGKTEELIRRLKRSVIAKRKTQVFKPRIDSRYDAGRGGQPLAAEDGLDR